MTYPTPTPPRIAAQAVMRAYLNANAWPDGRVVATVLVAAADQVVPENGSRRNNEIRAEFLAIAAELGGPQRSYSPLPPN